MTDHFDSPDSPSTPDWDALARLMAGESSAEESAEVRRHLAEDAARASLVGVLSQVGRRADPVPPTPAETERALAAVLARRDMAAPVTPVVSLESYRGNRIPGVWRVAAAIVAIAGAGLLWRGVSGTSAPAEKHFASAVGALKEVTLADGTKIVLGPSSDLTLGDDFNGRSRDVTLQGEARFDVVHNTAKPFVVHTSSGSFRDVGTVFSVHTDVTSGSRVAVSEGAVAVERDGADAVTLHAGDRAQVPLAGTVAVERAVVTSRDFAWTKGDLVFQDATVADVAAEVRRWYGIDLVVDSSLAGRRITTTFTRADDRTTVARTVASVLGGGVHDEGAAIRIVPAPTANPRK